MQTVARVKIHPAIGIARLGDAVDTSADVADREDFFIGPIKPGKVEHPEGGYKLEGLVKRQAAQFRLFAYDENDKLIGELTADQADLRWTVTLANTKGSWLQFNGQMPGPNRNAHVTGLDREKLNIKPAPKTLDGAQSGPFRFDDAGVTAFHFDKDGGNRSTKIVPSICLGEAMTDDKGRLLVLGGSGRSASPFDTQLESYANNDTWFDDVSDGSVDATVTLNDGRVIEAEGAWVIATVPKFAPDLQNFVTLYDMLMDKAVREGNASAPEETNYNTDVAPFLDRVMELRWLMGTGPVHDFAVTYARGAEATKAQRGEVFNRLRNPRGGNTGLQNMPMILNNNDAWRPEGDTGFAITTLQYDHLQRWYEGTASFEQAPPPPDGVTPEGMDRAALENCCGGPFYPGMEAGWMLKDVFEMVPGDPFRLSRLQSSSVTGRLEPGDLTKQMALPWQSDFLECRRDEEKPYLAGWWPQQRPEMVTPFGDANPVQWTRGLPWEDRIGMVENWSRLGFILAEGGGFYEQDRGEVHPSGRALPNG